MNIICPQCGFSRPFPPDRAPAHSVIATCPQCSCRFRFHPQDGSSEQLSPVRNEAAPAASDLPPGAIIPGIGDDGKGGAPCRREDPREEIPPFRPRDRQEEPKPQADDEPLEDDFRDDDADDNRPGLPSGNPWDVAPSGWMVAFYRTATRIMFGAPAFFSCLRPHRRSLRALSFYLIVSVILSVVQLLWMRGMTSMLVDGGMDPQMQQMMASTLAIHESMPLFVLKQVAFVTLQLYVQSALLYLMYRLILRDKPDLPGQRLRLGAHAAVRHPRAGSAHRPGLEPGLHPCGLQDRAAPGLEPDVAGLRARFPAGDVPAPASDADALAPYRPGLFPLRPCHP